jgi:hypothetical protein
VSAVPTAAPLCKTVCADASMAPLQSLSLPVVCKCRLPSLSFFVVRVASLPVSQRCLIALSFVSVKMCPVCFGAHAVSPFSSLLSSFAPMLPSPASAEEMRIEGFRIVLCDKDGNVLEEALGSDGQWYALGEPGQVFDVMVDCMKHYKSSAASPAGQVVLYEITVDDGETGVSYIPRERGTQVSGSSRARACGRLCSHSRELSRSPLC